MPLKRVLIDNDVFVAKRQCKNVTWEVKLEVIRQIDAVERAVDVAGFASNYTFHLPPTTVRSIDRHADVIREIAKRATPLLSKQTTKLRTRLCEDIDFIAAFDHIEAAFNIFEKGDSLCDRSAMVVRKLHDGISCCK